MPPKVQVAVNQWLSDQDLAIYVRSFQRQMVDGLSSVLMSPTKSPFLLENAFFALATWVFAGEG
jgi:hypothetical protein